MNVREYLARPFVIHKQIEHQRQKITLLRMEAENINTEIKGDSVLHSKNVYSQQDAVLRLVEAEEELKRREAALEEALDANMRLIASVDFKDEQTQTLLELRYYLLKSWKEVGEIMHYGHSTLHRLHRCGLIEMSQLP